MRGEWAGMSRYRGASYVSTGAALLTVFTGCLFTEDLITLLLSPCPKCDSHAH